MFRYENQALREGFSFVIGVDEAGRGPLAGPVVAAAVSLRNNKFTNRICDSKKLTSLKRQKAYHEIFDKAYVGVGIISESVIDQCNILEATYHAMSVAVEHLISKISPETVLDKKQICLLIDGRSFKTDLPYKFKAIIGGDDRSFSIACASIVAKVTRDRILSAYDKVFPEYGFKQHKGYGTLAHRAAIKKYGPSLIHRKTFQGVL